MAWPRHLKPDGETDFFACRSSDLSFDQIYAIDHFQ
jgi:hypothetical protein